MRRFAALTVALLATLMGGDAFAARVRFLSDAGTTFDRRVSAELESVGFEVERPVSPELPLPADTVAIVSASSAPLRVEVWLIDAHGSASLSTVIEHDPSVSEDVETTRVAERLRALLQPLAPASERPPLPPPPPPREPEPAKPPPEREPVSERPALLEDPPSAPSSPARSAAVAFDLAAAALAQPGGLAASAFLRARYDVFGPFGASLLFALPVTKSTVRDGPASAELDARVLGGAAHIHVVSQPSNWQLRVGAGGGVVWLTAIGDAEAPQRGRSESAVYAMPFATLDGARRLTGDLYAGAGVLAGVSLPRAEIELGGEPVGSWGRPLLLVHLGLGYDP